MIAARRAVVECARRSIALGSKSFALASRLFDRPMRERAQMLYAWCRHCDDVIDGQVGGQGLVVATRAAGERLAALRAGTRAAFAGDADAVDAFAALAHVANETGLPQRLADAHLDGFGMDVDDRRYRHIDDTLDYCHHVAGVVGEMMAIVMGVSRDDGPVLMRAADLGIAFQLTNIVRDIAEDGWNDRCYLPEDWLADAAIPPGDHMRPEHRGALVGIALRLLDLADQYYASAAAGAARLPFRARWAVLAAAEVYRAIGKEVRAAGAHAWDHRTSTTLPTKLRLLARAYNTARALDPAAPLPERPPLWHKPN